MKLSLIIIIMTVDQSQAHWPNDRDQQGRRGHRFVSILS